LVVSGRDSRGGRDVLPNLPDQIVLTEGAPKNIRKGETLRRGEGKRKHVDKEYHEDGEKWRTHGGGFGWRRKDGGEKDLLYQGLQKKQSRGGGGFKCASEGKDIRKKRGCIAITEG